MVKPLLRRGDIAFTDFAPAREGEANYTRPAIIITNNQANVIAPVVTVIPLISNVERIYPMQLFLPNERTGLDRDSKAQVELLRHVAINRIRKVIGYMPEDLMLELNAKLKDHLGLS
ncbi:MAG: type II toxin-antitoxin system PemK/MazF family toxin [Trueperaceae bacterium]